MSRINLLASFCKDANSIVDVGCDHGYVAIKAIKEFNVGHAYLLDVNEMPLENARKNIVANNLVDRTKLILSDGLLNYDDETDTLIISGMGGNLIVDILTKSLSKAKSFKRVILQANTDVDRLRGFLINNKFIFDDEEIIKDGKKIYEVIVCHHDDKDNTLYSKLDMKFGPILRKKKSPLFLDVVNQKKVFFESCLTKATDDYSKSKIKIELALISLLLGEING